VDVQKINDLIDEIRSLVKALGTGGASSGGASSGGSKAMTDKSAAQLVAALGVLASKLGGAARNRKEEIRAANDFANSVTVAARRAEKQAKKSEDFANAAAANAKQLRRASLSAKQIANEQAAAAKKQKDADNAALAASISNQRRQTSSSREVFEAAKQASGGLGRLNDKFLDLGKGSVAAQSGLQLISAVAGGAAKALMGYSAAIQNGERGAKLSGRALEQFATPVLDTISTMGTLAMLLPGVGKIFGKTAGAAAKTSSKMLKLGGAAAIAGAEVAKFGVKFVQTGLDQTDKLFDSFQRLSQVGISGSQGLDDVFGMLQEIGLSTGQIEQFNSVLANNSQRIKFLGATAFDGAKELAKVAGGLYKSKLGQQLENLGVTQQEMNELSLVNLSIEARSGQLRKRTDEELKRSTYEFVKELDMAAQLTGASRKEMAEAREAALTEERFRSALVDAKNRGDQEEIKRLEKARDMAAIIKKAGDEKGATGILQLAASGGAMTTETAQAAEMQYGVNAVLNSQGSVIEGVKQMVDTSRENQKNLAGINKLTGTIGALQTGVVEQANVIDRIGPAIDKAGSNPEALLKMLQEEQKKREAATSADGTLNKTGIMVDAARMQQNAALIQDKAIFQLSNATTIHAAATKMFEGAVKKFGEVVGTMPTSQVSTDSTRIAAAQRDAYNKKLDRDSKSLAGSAAKSLPGAESEKNTALLAREMKNRGIAEEVARAQSIADSIINWFSTTPKYAAGGIASGPGSGHMAMLHGTEAVIPLSGGSIPLKILSSGIDAGPAFSPQTETNYLLEKNTEEIVKANVTLSQMLEAITGGATITGGGGARTTEQVAQEALAEHDHAHPHGEKGEVASPELAAQIAKGFVNPLEKMVQTSGFVRNDGKTGHGAIDLAGKIGDKIMAPISGVARVLSEKESGGYGNMVEVTDSVTGVKHMLAHMDKTMVKTGDVIKAGQQIGTVGNTGKSTGAHLHHEIRDKSGKKIDPSQFYTGVTDPQGRPISRPGFGSTAGGAATGYPQMAPKGNRGAAPIPGGVKGNLDMMTRALQEQGITDPKMINATLANVMKETGGKINVEEDLAGYANTSNERIRKIFGARAAKKSDKELDQIKKDPKQFAEMMYGKDSGMGLGNVEEGDAYKFRGRGAVGLTGRANYAAASKDLFGDDRLVKDPELLKDPEMAAKTSAWFMKKHTGAMSKRLGMAGGPKTQEDADLLATSTIAGQAIKPGQGFLGTEALGKVSGYSAQIAGGQLPVGAAPGQPTSPVASLAQSVMGMFGLGGGAPVAGPGQADVAGVTAGGAPGAISGDISAITQAMEAQTAATQTAITSGMENLTTQLVDKLGGGSGGTADPAVPALLTEMISAQREQTSAINKLIQVSTA
jgi:murein DD-endopeptidase MepM/ murein hydrolase activator NlpD/predicted chitinase